MLHSLTFPVLHALSDCLVLQAMLGDPQIMAKMMNSPLVQRLLSDPEVVRTMFQNIRLSERCARCAGGIRGWKRERGLVGQGAGVGGG